MFPRRVEGCFGQGRGKGPEVGFGPRSEGGFGITADLTITLPGVAKADAEKLAQAAHEVCPYSNATRNNVDVGLHIA